MLCLSSAPEWGPRDAVEILSGVAVWNLATWLLAFRPRVCLSDDELLVVNPWWTHRIPVREIESVAPGYDGLLIRRRDRRPVHAWAVQESNFKLFANRPSRAKRVSATLNALLEESE